MSSNETITIVPMDEENLALFNSFPSSFTITGNVWAGNDGFFHFFVEEFPEPHAAKTYPDGTLGEAEGQAVFFAMDGLLQNAEGGCTMNTRCGCCFAAASSNVLMCRVRLSSPRSGSNGRPPAAIGR